LNDTKSKRGETHSKSSQPAEIRNLSAASEKRLHQRFASAVKVSVEIPFVPTLAFAARDFSREGMRLDFRDASAGFRAFHDNLIEPGSGLMIRFRISIQGKSHECSVKAEIVRLTEQGIGVHFGDPTPWQLVKLVEMFAKAYPERDTAAH
jgi:hypothetical protein